MRHHLAANPVVAMHQPNGFRASVLRCFRSRLHSVAIVAHAMLSVGMAAGCGPTCELDYGDRRAIGIAKGVAGDAIEGFNREVKDGLALYFADEGRMELGSHRDGKREGLWLRVGPATQIVQCGTYQNGLKEGYWVLFDSIGAVDESGSGLFKEDNFVRRLHSHEVEKLARLGEPLGR